MVAKLSWGAVIVFHRSCFGVGSSCWRRMESPEKSSKCGVASIPDDQVEDAMFCVKEVILAATDVLLKVLWGRFGSKDAYIM